MQPPHILINQYALFTPMQELKLSEKIGYCFGIANMGMQAILVNDLDTFDRRLIMIATSPKNTWEDKIALIKQQRLDIIRRVKKNLKNKRLKAKDISSLEKEAEIQNKIDSLRKTVDQLVNEGKLTQQTRKNEFEKRKKQLLLNAYKQKRIDAAWKKVSCEQQLLADIPNFLEGVEIYQNSSEYPQIDDYYPRNAQSDSLSISSLLMSKKLEAQGGLLNAKTFTGVYTSADLTNYFQSMKDNFPYSTTQPLALILRNESHAITVGYRPHSGKWVCIDANQLPSKESDRPDEVADWVMDAFSSEKYVTFSTEVFMTQASASSLISFVNDWCHSKLFIQLHNAQEKCNFANKNQSTWLYIAAKMGDMESIKDLLAHGANPNQALLDGYTPLMIAAQYNHSNAVQLLLQNNANPNLVNHDGDTALILSSILGHTKTAKTLLRNGANPNHVTSEGLKAFDYAMGLKNKSLALFILAEEKKSLNNLSSPMMKQPYTPCLFSSAKPDVQDIAPLPTEEQTKCLLI